MLSKILYNLCLLITTPFENLNLISNNTYDLNYFILEEMYLKKLFNFKWRKKLNSSFSNFKFNYNYKILDQNSNFIKLKVNLKIYFLIQNSQNNIPSAFIHKYIIILEHLQNKFKVQCLIQDEENPLLYNYALNNNLSNIENLISFKKQDVYKNKLSSIDSLYEIFMTSQFFSSSNLNYRKSSSFNIVEACNYAETFALKPNPNYKSFDGIGGDCTNFASQILYTGGTQQTKTWSPYTNPWIRVEDLYLYLTIHKLATELPNKNSLSKGCLIQFFTPKIGRFFHNGFITYELPNNDYLYCCHSYNKLNYPLSEIYPNRYPKLRGLMIN